MHWEKIKLITNPSPNFIAVKNRAMMVSNINVKKSDLAYLPPQRRQQPWTLTILGMTFDLRFHGGLTSDDSEDTFVETAEPSYVS